MNRNYRLFVTFADGSNARVKLPDYSLLVSTLLWMMLRSLTFTYTATCGDVDFTATDYTQLDSAVAAWLDTYRSKSVMDHLDEARAREQRPYLYCEPRTAIEAEEMMF